MTEFVDNDCCPVGPPIIPVDQKLPVGVMSSLVRAGEWKGPHTMWSIAPAVESSTTCCRREPPRCRFLSIAIREGSCMRLRFGDCVFSQTLRWKVCVFLHVARCPPLLPVFYQRDDVTDGTWLPLDHHGYEGSWYCHKLEKSTPSRATSQIFRVHRSSEK